MTLPDYWMQQACGPCRDAVETYLLREPMTAEQIDVMRDYLRNWIDADDWGTGAELAALRRDVINLDNPEAIRAWVNRADEIGIDPL